MNMSFDLSPAKMEEIFGPRRQEVKPNIVTDEEKKDPLRMMKVELHSLLTAEQCPISSREVAYRYYDNFDCDIDYYSFGYNSLDALLQAMPDKIFTLEKDGIYYYAAKSDERVLDIKSLVSRQLTKEQIFQKKLKQKNSFSNLPKQTVIKKIDFDGDPFLARNVASNTNDKVNKPQEWANQDSKCLRKTQLNPANKTEIQSRIKIANSQFGYQIEALPIENELETMKRNGAIKSLPNRLNNNCSLNNSNAEGTTLSNDLERLRATSPLNDVTASSRESSFSTNFTWQKKVRRARETDLLWLVKAPFLLSLNKFSKVAFVHMINAKVYLVSTIWGNGNRKRFTAINEILRSRAQSFVKAENLHPGRLFVIRSGDEFARGILLGSSQIRGHLHFACFDFHGTAEIHTDSIYELPPELKETAIPGNVFIAVVRGVEEIKEESFTFIENILTEPKSEVKTAKPCVIYSSLGRACIDMVFENEGKPAWLSDILLESQHGTRWPEDDHLFQTVDIEMITTLIQKLEGYRYFHMRSSNLKAFAPVPLLTELIHIYPNVDAITSKILQANQEEEMFEVDSISEITEPISQKSNETICSDDFEIDTFSIEMSQSHSYVTEEEENVVLSPSLSLKKLANETLSLIQERDIKQVISHKFIEVAYMLKTFIPSTMKEIKCMDEVIEELSHLV